MTTKPAPVENFFYDLLVRPVVRDADVIVPGILFWFVVQYATQFLAPVLLGKLYRRMPKAEQTQLPIRMCAVVNGLICLRSAYLYIFVSRDYQQSLYEVVPGYRVPLALLISYFMWDTIVCVVYKWGWAFTLHGIVSGVGMILCAYPCSDGWSSYYAGVYECSNVFLHLSAILSAMDVLPTVAMVFNLIFAVLFFAVRIVIGTISTAWWTQRVYETVMQDDDTLVHSRPALYLMAFLLWGIIALQFFWSTAIISAIKDKVKPPKTAEKKVEQKKMDPKPVRQSKVSKESTLPASPTMRT